MFIRRVKGFLKLTTIVVIRFFYRLLGGKVIHVIGDSHALAFQDYHFCVHHLGAVTAYNLINKQSSSGGRERLLKIINQLSGNRDAVMLVFGEIDARIHVFNQYMKKQKKTSIQQIIKNIIDNYGQVIEEIRNKNITVAVYNVTPPGPQRNVYKYPYYASWEMRLRITKQMNQLLAKLCLKKKIEFIDIYDQVTNTNKILPSKYRRREYIFDEVHLNNKITKLVLKQLLEKGILGDTK